jgi:hypothetical protein
MSNDEASNPIHPNHNSLYPKGLRLIMNQNLTCFWLFSYDYFGDMQKIKVGRQVKSLCDSDHNQLHHGVGQYIVSNIKVS